MESAIEAFHIDVGQYPTNKEGLSILVENTSNLPNWKGPYIHLHPDPWGNDYVYKIPGQYNPASFDILSAGPDGMLNTPDDLHN